MDLKDFFNRKTLFASRVIGEDLILVPVKSNVADMNEIFTLNEVGRFIWDCIDGVNTLDDIVNLVISVFDVERDMAIIDVSDFLNRLHGIMEKVK